MKTSWRGGTLTLAGARRRGGNRWAGSLIRAVAVSVVLLACGWLLLPKPPPLLEGLSFSRLVTDRHGQPLHVTLSADGKFRLWTPLTEIAPEFIEATRWQEDRHYRMHPGVNPVAAARSAWAFVRGGGRQPRAGASTISMQLARLRYGLRTRTLRGKLTQMFRALQMERHYPKTTLLEAYLNLAPYGGNVEGVGAASRLYFGKSARALTRPEGIALSVIPQSPARRTPRAGREDPALNAAHARLYDRLLAAGVQDLDPAGRDFRVIPGPRPFAAPHFTTALLGELPEIAATGGGEVRTTLDLDLQRLLERQVEHTVAIHTNVGLRNAAALLVDTHTMEVLAHVGSADFFNPGIDGQVDGTRRPRSPGSALKPFVYALALDEGLIHPRSLVADAPRRFGDYEPENFDRAFAGPLSATDALVRSRNVPAVALGARLRAPGFYGFLRAAGVRLPGEEGFYGLTLPLGGAEVTMEDLARLYASLANGGEWRALRRVLPGGATGVHGPVLLSPEAAFLTLEMLRQTPAPELAGGGDPAFPVAWKTGTSHGFRDAWAAAVFDHYVLVVWVGEADGRANPAFVGRTAAGPLLFSIIHALRAGGVARSPEPPPATADSLNLRRVELCAVTGGLPTAACRHRTPGWFIPGVSPIAPCQVHRETLLDVATGLRVPTDDGTRELRREVFEFWPADLLALFRQAGMPRRGPPPFLPETAGSSRPTAPGTLRILSPRPDQTYAVHPGGKELPLRAQAEPDATQIYWFADGAMLGRTAPGGNVAWQPTPGHHNLLALDDQGRSATCGVSVEAR